MFRVPLSKVSPWPAQWVTDRRHISNCLSSILADGPVGAKKSCLSSILGDGPVGDIRVASGYENLIAGSTLIPPPLL